MNNYSQDNCSNDTRLIKRSLNVRHIVLRDIKNIINTNGPACGSSYAKHSFLVGVKNKVLRSCI